MEIFKTKEIVADLLEKSPKCRDCDSRLIANVWSRCIKKATGKDIFHISCYEFLETFAIGKLPSAEGIARTRRKLQECHPELRGNTWDERHKISEEVRTNMHTAVKTL